MQLSNIEKLEIWDKENPNMYIKAFFTRNYNTYEMDPIGIYKSWASEEVVTVLKIPMYNTNPIEYTYRIDVGIYSCKLPNNVIHEVKDY